jgi:hypothetical protein
VPVQPETEENAQEVEYLLNVYTHDLILEEMYDDINRILEMITLMRKRK